jgi:phosphoenolpyruvate carboxylase
MYLNVKHTLKGPVDIATKFDYWYLNVKHTLKGQVDIATKRSLSVPEIMAMKQQTQFLWETYFSSVDKIVNTVLQVSNGCYVYTGSFIV